MGHFLQYFFLTAFAIGFGWLAIKNFRLAVQGLILLFPAYLVRFSIGPLPSTLLELGFGVVFVVWLVKYFRSDWRKIKSFLSGHKFFSAALAIFFAASIISIFRSDMVYYSLGQWRAYFLEPILFFFVLMGRADEIDGKDLTVALGLSTISIALFGVVQQFTGWHLPTNDGQVITNRVTSFFSSPNAVGLYAVPVLMLLLPAVIKSDEKCDTNKCDTNIRMHANNTNQYEFGERDRRPEGSARKISVSQIFYLFVFFINIIALLLTKSIGAVAALVGGTAIFLFFSGRKKGAVALVVVPVLLGAILFVPFKDQLEMKIKSGGNRLTLWSYSWQYLSASPDNFVFGTGVRQFFRKVQKPFYEPKKMERLIYPHNIFLNFWTETGLLGMAGFVGIFGCLVYFSLKLAKIRPLLVAPFLASLGAILVHGMVDVPYFKNDLAFLFWIIAAIIVFAQPFTISPPSQGREGKGSGRSSAGN